MLGPKKGQLSELPLFLLLFTFLTALVTGRRRVGVVNRFFPVRRGLLTVKGFLTGRFRVSAVAPVSGLSDHHLFYFR